MASNNFLAMEAGFSLSEMLLSRSSDIEFFSEPFAKRRINAFISDFIKDVSKSLLKSEYLFGFLRKFVEVNTQFFFLYSFAKWFI